MINDSMNQSDIVGEEVVLYETPELDSAEHKVIDSIDELKDRLRLNLHEPRRWIGSLRRLAFARAIQGSNSIEGYDASLDDAAAVALGEDPLDVSAETRLALAGYRDAMTYVLQLATDADADFAYSTQLLKALHFMMTSYSLNNNPGQWRPRGIFVRKEQTGEIVYEGPDRELVPSLMAELVEQLNEDDNGTPRLVRAAMAHLNLVMIHPFRDGNGRMARCSQSLVLAQGGVLSPVFMSIEEYLGANTDGYYAVLGDVGQGKWNPHHDARPWLRFSLTAHLRQARTMLRRVKETERLWIELEQLAVKNGLPDRAISALFDALSGLRVRNSTYRAGLKDAGEEISVQTAARDLAQLVHMGLLTARGQARGRVYGAGETLVGLRKWITDSRDPRDDTDPFAPPASTAERPVVLDVREPPE
jgi:Fic family protein